MWNQVGPQAIPVSEVINYVRDVLGLTNLEERQQYVRIINLMDSVELRYLNEKRKAATK